MKGGSGAESGEPDGCSPGMSLEMFFRPHLSPKGEPAGIIEVAKLAEEHGFRSVLFGEHLAIGQQTDRYPYGVFPKDCSIPWLEPMTTLAAIASVTDRLKLSTGVLLGPLRPPLLLAKTVATLDVLSCGRVELGVGVGWQREEYDAIGVPWENRYQRFEETVVGCRRIWGEQPVSLRSGLTVFEGRTIVPGPIQDTLRRYL